MKYRVTTAQSITKLKLLHLALISIALMMAAVAAQAGNLITNGGFDTGTVGWSPVGNDGNGGWRSVGGNPGGYFIINAAGQSLSDPSISQTISGLSVGSTYHITGDYRNNYGCCGAQVGQISFGVDIDGVEIAALPNPGTGWSPFTVSFVATSSTHTLRFRSEINGNDTDMAIDNIGLDEGAAAPVPVPATNTWMLLLLSLMILGVTWYIRPAVMRRS
jgi:hypothetical protein